MHFNRLPSVHSRSGITLWTKLQKLQNRAAHVLTLSNYDADAGYLFELFNWIEEPSSPAANPKSYDGLYRSPHGLAPDLRDSDNKLSVPLLRTNYKL